MEIREGKFTRSQLSYPKGHVPKTAKQQLEIWGKLFPRLDGSHVRRIARKLSRIFRNGVPEADLILVAPKQEKVAENEIEAIEQMLNLIAASRSFKDWHTEINLGLLKREQRTSDAIMLLNDKCPGDFLVFPVQFGFKRQKQSAEEVRQSYGGREFGLGLYLGCAAILTHPERVTRDVGTLLLDIPGSEYDEDNADGFRKYPYFGPSREGIKLGLGCIQNGFSSSGHATGFVPV